MQSIERRLTNLEHAQARGMRVVVQYADETSEQAYARVGLPADGGTGLTVIVRKLAAVCSLTTVGGGHETVAFWPQLGKKVKLSTVSTG